MRNDAWLNNQDILNWYKTPDIMEFTDDGFPILLPLKNFKMPRRGVKFLPFNYAMSNNDKNTFIHFYIQDYQFNRIWNNPMKYIDILAKYKGIVMPDFSLYTDMPEPLQRFNHYRNLWFARMCQIQGITVIPSSNWSTKDSLDWCLEGMPKNSIIMLSAVGSIKNPEVFDNFIYCAKYVEERLKPIHILLRCPKKSYNRIQSLIDTTCSFVNYTV